MSSDTDTPKKIKLHHLRSPGAHRTRKSRPYHGTRNLKVQRAVGEGLAPRHGDRAYIARGYKPYVWPTRSVVETATPKAARIRSSFWASAFPWRASKKESVPK